MRRIAIGLVVGVGIWVGSAVAAEAQTIQIQPVGPTANARIHVGDAAMMICSDITPNPAGVVYARVEVLVNGQSVYTTPYQALTITGTKRWFKSVPLTSLILKPGDNVVFRTECGFTNTNFNFTADSPAVPVIS